MKVDTDALNLFSDANNIAIGGRMSPSVTPHEHETTQDAAKLRLDQAKDEATNQLRGFATGEGYSIAEVDKALEKINQYAEIQQVNLRLSVDKELNQVVVRVLDKDTDEVIRQIPSEQAIALAKKIDEVMQEFFIGGSDLAINLLDDRA